MISSRLGYRCLPRHSMLTRVVRPKTAHPSLCMPGIVQYKRYDAFDAHLDPEVLAEARRWRKGFDWSMLPEGSTTFARSSGPGGQHVNKTETKATSVFPVYELARVLPHALRSALQKSRYYVASSDSLNFQSQTSRSRTSNQEENKSKLWEEILRIYDANVPGETSEAKREKHRNIAKVSF
ncbi:hypothetical protein VHEMI07584 [[Torrubiella] hemipterigena]|uniref:Prokaryotic-type class I peptide chain release factors domain-containing protein n=1 Tax=[Torrubiella] hemipterigena TaxID=1531966 RepID=A0A0A1T3Y9_9HYPO|nr:hypothetical protein VHEMI07584 [[Torrubiella] hemipterigena]